jgi:hypothetical protein
MRVVIRQPISGTRNGESWPAVGSEIDLPDHEAEKLVRSGVAAKVAKEPVPKGRASGRRGSS